MAALELAKALILRWTTLRLALSHEGVLLENRSALVNRETPLYAY
jgi:hypothetical protein